MFGGMALGPSVRNLLTVMSIVVATLSPAERATAEVATEQPWYPRSMAAMGDSITRGFGLCVPLPLDCEPYSWASGNAAESVSHLRGIERDSGHVVAAANVARSGATSYDLPRQARLVAASGAEYVTLLIGANDVCAPGGMTPVSGFQANLRSALKTIATSLPQARLLLVSVPNLAGLAEIGTKHVGARVRWEVGGICQVALARPGSADPADVARLADVDARVRAYNTVLARVCRAYGPSCRTDGGRVYAHRLSYSELALFDRFHPSRLGQATLASQTYDVWFGASGGALGSAAPGRKNA